MPPSSQATFICVHNPMTAKSGVYTILKNTLVPADGFARDASLDLLIASINEHGISKRSERLQDHRISISLTQTPPSEPSAVVTYLHELNHEACAVTNADQAMIWVFTHQYILPDSIRDVLINNIDKLDAVKTKEILTYFQSAKTDLDALERAQKEYERTKAAIDATILSSAAALLQPYLTNTAAT